MLLLLLFEMTLTCFLSSPPAPAPSFWQHVENKWISSSKEIITFRKALLNPITAFQFQRFVSLKGDLLENGVLFWQEVQKYKVYIGDLHSSQIMTVISSSSLHRHGSLFGKGWCSGIVSLPDVSSSKVVRWEVMDRPNPRRDMAS